MLAMMWPTLTAPLTGDERYNYLYVLGDTRGSWTTLVTNAFQEIPSRMRHDGRFAPLTFITQWSAYLAVPKFAIMTGSSVVVGVAATKLLCFALAVLSFRVLASALRVRPRRGGSPRQLTPESAATGTLVFAVLLACGIQTQDPAYDAWVAYAALTWPTIAICLATAWATVRLTDRLASKPRAWISTLVPMVVIGLALNSSYELYYVAAPMALLVLVAHQPPPELSRPRPVWTQPKFLVGSALGGSFLFFFVLIRYLISAACKSGDCYQATQPELGMGALRTSWLNLASSVPAFGRGEASRNLEAYAPDLALAHPGQGPGWLISLVMLAALLVLWRTRPGPAPGSADEQGVWVVLGLAGLAMAVGTSFTMGVSVLSQDFITTLGQPYRNTVATWAGLSMALVGLSMLLLPRRQRGEVASEPRAGSRDRRTIRLAVAAAPLCIVVVWAGLVVWPVNSQVIRVTAAAPTNVAVHDMMTATLRPDLGRTGNRDRCALVKRFHRDNVGSMTSDVLPKFAATNFAMLWGIPFCDRNPRD